jgi:hypothetical protein
MDLLHSPFSTQTMTLTSQLACLSFDIGAREYVDLHLLSSIFNRHRGTRRHLVTFVVP